jgi:hypothetical protein
MTTEQLYFPSIWVGEKDENGKRILYKDYKTEKWNKAFWEDVKLLYFAILEKQNMSQCSDGVTKIN